MKSPDNRETTNRSEMMCTRCNEEGLEPHPAYVDEYEGRYELLKATRCPNEDCVFHKRGVPEDKIEIQMPEKSLLDSLTGGINKDTIKSMLILFGGLGFLAFQMGIIPPGQSGDTTTEPTADQSLDIKYADSINSVESFLLYNNTTRVGKYILDNNTGKIENISQGSYAIYSNTNNEFDPPGYNINVTEDTDTINITNITSTNSTITDINESLGNVTLEFNYTNPNNVRDISLNMSPIPGERVERDWVINTDRENNVIMPQFPVDQRYVVDAPVTTEEFTYSKTFSRNPQNYEIYGNQDPENVSIQLVDKEPGDTEVSDTIKLSAGQSSQIGTINVKSESTLGNASIILKNGTYEDREQSIGVWDGQGNISVNTGVDGYIDNGQIRIEPKPTKSQRTIPGTVTNNTTTHNFEGNVDPENVTINYKGGDVNSALSGKIEKNVSGKNGTTGNLSEKITTVQNSGTYRVVWDYNKTQNPDLVNFWYKKENGNKRPLNFDSGTESIDLNEDQNVLLVTSAKRKTISQDEESPTSSSLSSQLDVNLRFAKENPDPGENVNMYLNVTNTGSQTLNEEFIFYRNGERFRTQQLEIPGNSQVTFGPRDLGVPSMGPEGTNVWFVNEKGPFFIEVGDSQPTYGTGDIDIEVRELGAEGRVNVSVNNQTCSALASGGNCTLTNITSGQNVFEFDEKGVVNTDYEISYTKVENPRDVAVDVGDDNINNIEQNGVLTSSKTETVELPPNIVNLDIDSGNNIPVRYILSWNSNAVIQQPIIDKSGDIIINESDNSFVGPKEFNIGQLEQGNHTFRLRSGSGGYTAEIVWNEREGQSYPSVYINQDKACSTGDFAGNAICNTSVGTNVGTNTIDFRNTTETGFNYRLQYDSRTVANNINISVNNQNTRITRPNPSAEAWQSVTSTSDFQTGKNKVDVSVEKINNIRPDVNLSLKYVLDTSTVENPNITLINSNGTEHNISVDPSSLNQDQLVSTTELDIPSEYLTVGMNRLKIELKSGVYKLDGKISHSTNDTVQYEFD